MNLEQCKGSGQEEGWGLGNSYTQNKEQYRRRSRAMGEVTLRSVVEVVHKPRRVT